MDIQNIRIITQFFAAGLFFYYVTNFIFSYYSVRQLKVPHSHWHLGMCFTSAIYCFGAFLGTIDWGPGAGEVMSSVNWVVGTLSATYYLLAIQNMFDIRSKIVEAAKYSMIFMGINHLVALVLFSTRGIHFDYMYTLPPEGKTGLAQLLYNTSGIGSDYANGIAAIGSFFYLGGAAYIILNLRRREKDVWLQMGAIVSFFTVVNDTFFGLGLFEYTIPLFMFGNAVEASRFTRYYQDMVLDSALKLQEEVLVQKQKVNQAKVSHSLLQMLSHDIGNGLMLIEAGLWRFVSKAEPSPEVANLERLVEKGMKSIANTSKAARAYEKALQNENFIAEPVPLHNVVDELKDTFSLSLKDKGVELEIAPIDESLFVLGERNLLTNQVLGNFLSNAIKFSPKGGRIRVEAESHGEYVKVCITDEGVGMDAEAIKSILETNEVVSTEGTNNEEGTGFGTGIALQIIKRFGGTLEIDSSVDGPKRGTRMITKLRVAEVAAMAA